MVTVQKTNLSVTVPEYFRDLLRNNLTNPASNTQEWIFKDNPETGITDKADEMPIVIVEDTTSEDTIFALKGSRSYMQPSTLTITVYSFNQYHRDTICDEIRSTILDTTNTDSNGDTLLDNGIRVRSIQRQTLDTFIDRPKMLRVKELTITYRYIGG